MSFRCGEKRATPLILEPDFVENRSHNSVLHSESLSGVHKMTEFDIIRGNTVEGTDVTLFDAFQTGKLFSGETVILARDVDFPRRRVPARMVCAVMPCRSAFGVVSGGIGSLGRSAAAPVESDLQLEHLFEFLEPVEVESDLQLEHLFEFLEPAEGAAAESPPGRPFPPAPGSEVRKAAWPSRLNGRRTHRAPYDGAIMSHLWPRRL